MNCKKVLIYEVRACFSTTALKPVICQTSLCLCVSVYELYGSLIHIRSLHLGCFVVQFVLLSVIKCRILASKTY